MREKIYSNFEIKNWFILEISLYDLKCTWTQKIAHFWIDHIIQKHHESINIKSFMYKVYTVCFACNLFNDFVTRFLGNKLSKFTCVFQS